MTLGEKALAYYTVELIEEHMLDTYAGKQLS